MNSSTEEFKIKVWQLHLKNLAFNVSSMTVLICLRERCTFRKGCCAEMFLLYLWIPFKLRMYVVMKIDYYWIAVVLKWQHLCCKVFFWGLCFKSVFLYLLGRFAHTSMIVLGICYITSSFKQCQCQNKKNSKIVIQQKIAELKDFYIQWLFGNFSKSISLRDISFICSFYPWK